MTTPVENAVGNRFDSIRNLQAMLGEHWQLSPWEYQSNPGKFAGNAICPVDEVNEAKALAQGYKIYGEAVEAGVDLAGFHSWIHRTEMNPVPMDFTAKSVLEKLAEAAESRAPEIKGIIGGLAGYCHPRQWSAMNDFLLSAKFAPLVEAAQALGFQPKPLVCH